MWSAFAAALQLLTRLPLPGARAAGGSALGLSVAFYPVVGFLIGLFLWAASRLLSGLDAGVQAALILALWVIATGALHLDGLADSADAWVGSHGDSNRALEIMRDPASGPVGVAVVVLVLLIKFSCLAALAITAGAAALWSVPLLARSAAAWVMLTTPYARRDGIASEIIANLRPSVAWGAVAVGVLVVSLIQGLIGLALAAVVGTVALALRLWMKRRIGGFTGDTLGATIELTEAAALLALVVAFT